MLRVQIRIETKGKFISRRELRALTTRVLRLVALEEIGSTDGEISVLFVDDSFIQELNKRFREKDRPTDVLSFLMDGVKQPESMEYLVLGDIAISLETARRQAAERQSELKDEVTLLLIHGMLHLLNYDDETPAEKRRMTRRQNALNKKFKAS